MTISILRNKIKMFAIWTFVCNNSNYKKLKSWKVEWTFVCNNSNYKKLLTKW